jgi:FtsH-binding integral membrane protein
MDDAAVYVVMVFLVMSGVIYANYKSVASMNNAKFAWLGMGLLGGLITIILGNLFLILLGSMGVIALPDFVSFARILLYTAIFIFALFISYDTAYIIKRTKSCNEKSVYMYPNYPMESFMIFIDLYNIFADLLHLQNLN